MPIVDEPADRIVNRLHDLASHACPLHGADDMHLWSMRETAVEDCRIDDGTAVNQTGMAWFVDTHGNPERNAYALMTRLRSDAGVILPRHLILIVVDETVSMRTVDLDGLDRSDVDPGDRVTAGDLFDGGGGGMLFTHLRQIGRWRGPMPFAAD